MSASIREKRQTARAFHVMTKPIGPICNLDCSYCFYLEKEGQFPENEQFRMSEEMLETYVRQYIEEQQAPEINFAWQGGEPTLLGVDFFRKAVEFQLKYADGKRITNAFQTNGTLLDDEWCSFLAENEFLVGLSIDGPPELHDTYRVDKRQNPTFDRVMRGLEFLKKHETEFNTLTVVNRANSQHPLDVYNFLKEIGSGYIQFIPLVERNPSHEAKEMGYDLNLPPDPDQPDASTPVTHWSVEAEAYGDFLIQIFDEWVRNDVGKTYVQFFDVALGNWAGMRGSLCFFSPTCGTAMAIEHNGDLYSCDHYVYGQYKLGNILNQSIAEMLHSDQQQKFGQDKLNTLPTYCLDCDVRFACHGECPKHRFMKTPDGDPGLNYLCPAYKKPFTHMNPYMQTMAQLLKQRKSPAMIMDMVKRKGQQDALKTANRNDPCPCGSGKKFKNCCGK